MPILTIPAIVKGDENIITLSRSTLLADSKVVADSYFNDVNNWKKISVIYETDVGNQKEQLIFDASLSDPTDIFDVSLTARDNWNVKAVTIFDFDGGYLRLYRGDLTTAEFDIVILPPLPLIEQLLSNNQNSLL